MTRDDLNKLAARLSNPAALITDLTDREDYCRDATEETGTPRALVFAATEADVVAVMESSHRHGVPIVARGTGTGLSGGCVPTPGSIVLSLERMKKVRMDPERRLAICEPGVITKELLDAAATHGLTYPPDPASYLECSLGGNVAENAGGLRCKRFGVTRDYVVGLRSVMPDGAVLRTGVLNDHRGFALGDLLIGSEGTLGVITQMALRLIETPAVGRTMLLAFDDAARAGNAVAEITAAGIIPSVMEYLDDDAAACSNQYERTEGLDRAAAILLIETDGARDALQAQAIAAIGKANGRTFERVESDPEKVEELWRVRRNLSKAVRDAARYRFNEDVVVPVSRFMELIAFVAELNRSGPLRVNAFGHAGDGNLHVSFLSMTGDDSEKALISAGVESLYRKTIALGGALTGEHGIGLHKGKYMHWEFNPATLACMRCVKDAIDPHGTLNPEKIFTK